jgi:hypothetical protein
MSSSFLDQLPLETIINILLHLPDAPSILKCRRINRTFRECIDPSLAIQYAVKLDAYGYEDCPVKRNSQTIWNTSDRLSSLDSVVTSFANLDWQSSYTLHLPRVLNVCDFAQGHYVGVRQEDSHFVIFCVRFSSRLLGTDGWTRDLCVVDFKIHSMVMDPSQDLLLVLEMLVAKSTLPPSLGL